MIMQTINMYDQLDMEISEEPGIKITTNLPYVPVNENNLVYKATNLPYVPVNENNLVYKATKMLMDEFQVKEGLTVDLQKMIPVAAGMAGGSSDYVPVNENNLVYKATKMLMDEFQVKEGLTVDLQKMIPVAAGMAGGSSDAAAAMIGVNRLFQLGLSVKDLMERGVKIVDLQKMIPVAAGMAGGSSDAAAAMIGVNRLFQLGLSVKDLMERGVKIGDLQKMIPVAAGMAGGSSDAAAAMIGVNRLFQLGLSVKDLMERGVKIGADVPYCLLRGTALAEGIGDKLRALPACPDCYVLIGKPGISVSTKFVYENLRANELKAHPRIDEMLDALQWHNLYKMADLMENVLETVTIPRYPIIEEIKNHMKEHGALNALMSGSGPTVFGLFDDKMLAEHACEALKESRLAKTVFLTTVFNNGGRRYQR